MADDGRRELRMRGPRRRGGAAAERAALSRARPGKQFPRVVRKQPNQPCILTGVVKQTGHELPPLEGFTNTLPRAILCLTIGLSGRVSEPSERLSPSHGRIEAPAVGDAVPRTEVLMRRRGVVRRSHAYLPHSCPMDMKKKYLGRSSS